MEMLTLSASPPKSESELSDAKCRNGENSLQVSELRIFSKVSKSEEPAVSRSYWSSAESSLNFSEINSRSSSQSSSVLIVDFSSSTRSVIYMKTGRRLPSPFVDEIIFSKDSGCLKMSKYELCSSSLSISG